jgi:hypothetical protein
MRKLIPLGLLVLVLFLVILSACTRERIVNQIVADTSCFTCHSDQNTAVLAAEKQWENSVHASGENINRNTSSCNYCHTNEGYVAKLTTGTAPSVVENPTAIGCFTCHAPHTNGDLTLRTVAAVTMMDGATYDRGTSNICANCHQSRRNVNTYVYDGVTFTSTHWGPHYNGQGDMLNGTNGYEYAGYTYTNSPHATRTINGCVDCHMYPSGTYVMGGHTWRMEHDGTENVAACNQDGCHASVDDFNYATADFPDGVQDSLQTLLDALASELVAAGLIDSVTYHPIAGRKVTLADSAGAVWNFLFVEEDKCLGIHNTKYAAALMNSSIDYLRSTLSMNLRASH